MGIVTSMKKIIKQGIFGNLKSINISFGDIHYNFDNFRSDIKKSGGGIFFEAGAHWIDCAIYTSGAQEILNFKSSKKFENYLDVESTGEFEIIDKKKINLHVNLKFLLWKILIIKSNIILKNAQLISVFLMIILILL